MRRELERIVGREVPESLLFEAATPRQLVTAIVAGRRGHGDVALGNVVGSNIFNILAILGATAMVTPVPIPPEIARFDLWVMLGATLLLLLFAATGRRIRRWEGLTLLSCYIAYYILVFAWPSG